MHEGDIVIAKGGSIGGISLVQSGLGECAISRDVIALHTDPKKIDSVYLVAFLLSRVGQLQLDRYKSQQVQAHLTFPAVGSVKVLLPPRERQTAVAELVTEALSHQTHSKTLYAQAQALLAAELGLDKLDLPTESIATRRLSEVKTANRIDAEYFHPKYQLIMARLERVVRRGWSLESLGDLSAPLKYGSSTKLDYIDSGLPFLRITDIRQYRFDPDEIRYISPEAAEVEQQATVQIGDVLVSRSGTLGIAVAIPSSLDRAVFGSYFIRTRPKTEQLDSVYLALYLNSLAGQFQVEQSNTGAIQTNLTIPAIESIRVVVPPLQVQQEFARKVLQAFQAQDDAKHLLAEAKAHVERMIEGA